MQHHRQRRRAGRQLRLPALLEAIEPRVLLSVAPTAGGDPAPADPTPADNPDLAVSTARLFPPATHTALAAGDAATVAVTVSNLSATVDVDVPFTGRVFLSRDAALSPDDLPLTSFQAANLPAGSSVPIGANVTIPDSSVAETWYTIAVVDPEGAVGDADATNNVSASGPLTLAPKTFTLVSVTPPATVRAGEPFTVTGTARVTGLHIDDPNFLSASLRRAGRPAIALTPSLAPIVLPVETDGSTDPTLVIFSATLTAPDDCPAGAYTLDVTPTLFKGTAGRANAYKSPTVRVSTTAPFLTVTTPTLSASSVSAGDALTVALAAINTGETPSDAATVTFYLSATPTLGASATKLGTAAVGPLDPDLSEAMAPSFAIPALAGGQYYVLATVRSTTPAAFDATSSDTSPPLPVTLLSPVPPDPDPFPTPGPAPVDLSITGVSAPPVVTANSTIPISLGSSPGIGLLPGATLVHYYLSKTGSLADAISVGVVAPEGTSYFKLPANVPAGAYHVVATIDPEDIVPESDETNNTFVSGETVTVYAADLRGSVSPSKPTTVRAEAPVGVVLTLTNRNKQRFNRKFNVTYYLSDDVALSPDDKRVAKQKLPVSLDRKQTRTVEMTVKLPAGTPLGSRYVIAALDTASKAPAAHLEFASPAPLKVTAPRVTARVRALVRKGASTTVTLKLTNTGTAPQTAPVTLRLSTAAKKTLYTTRRPLNLAPAKSTRVTLTLPSTALRAVDASTLWATIL